MADKIEEMINEGIYQFYSGMALGVDQWAAKAVLSFKAIHPHIQLIAVLPCESQPNRWTAEQQANYRAILKECDEAQTIGRNYTQQCMFQRNRRLVDQAGHLIAVYDGNPGGGTAYTVSYALKKKRRITIINNPLYYYHQ